MLKWKTSRRWAGLLALLCLSCLGSAARAQNVTLGIVDEDKVGDKYEKFIKAISGLDEQARDLDRAKMPAREFLNEGQGSRFDELVLKSVAGVLTAAETAELQSLVEAGMARRNEWTGLVSRANKTEAENKRIKELQDMAAKNSSAVTKIANDLFDAIKKRQEEIERQHTERANEIIKEIAAEKKLAVVMRKKAIVWNSNDVVDITDEVIERLNKAT